MCFVEYLTVTFSHGRIQGAITTLKPTKVTLITSVRRGGNVAWPPQTLKIKKCINSIRQWRN